jgi:Predicted membrane protein (DUF2306)
MFDVVGRTYASSFRARHLVFIFIAAIAAYILFHNERFLIEPSNPVWQHYRSIGWWLLIHGVAGASALILAPMQFSDRLRARFAELHRVVGRVYTTAVFVLAPLGAYIQYLDEGLAGASRSFTIASSTDAVLLMITTGIGFIFALKRMIPQHRQWMTRSYAVALVFFEVRFILGVSGLDQPFDFAVVETVVWVCLAFAVLIGDIANQVYDFQPMRSSIARTRPMQAAAAE